MNYGELVNIHAAAACFPSLFMRLLLPLQDNDVSPEDHSARSKHIAIDAVRKLFNVKQSSVSPGRLHGIDQYCNSAPGNRINRETDVLLFVTCIANRG